MLVTSKVFDLQVVMYIEYIYISTSLYINEFTFLKFIVKSA